MLNLKKNTIGILLTYIMCFCMSYPAFSQIKSRKIQRIERPMVVLDTTTLYADGLRISLWGIKTARSLETMLELQALKLIDKLIDGEMVRCRVMTWDTKEPKARCTVHTNEDIGLVLLQNGYAVIDRHQTHNSVFASAYFEAQRMGQEKRAGVWALMPDTNNKDDPMPSWLKPYFSSYAPLSLAVGPFLGLLILSVVVSRGFRRIKVEQETGDARAKEKDLLLREKALLAVSLEHELQDNKSKVEAFLSVYNEKLKILRDPSIENKYQQSGDMIGSAPVLNKTCFEDNADNLSVFGMRMSAEIAKVYGYLDSDPPYINLDVTMELSEAIKTVDQVVAHAQSLIPHIDYVLDRLALIAH